MKVPLVSKWNIEQKNGVRLRSLFGSAPSIRHLVFKKTLYRYSVVANTRTNKA